MRRTRVALLVVFAAAACATGGGVVRRSGAASPAQSLEQFTAALAAQRWPDAYALLSSPWRARYTPARLAADFAAAGSVAREAAERARALLAAGQFPVPNGRTATLAVGKGRAAVLVEEDGIWRVDALE